ncbi:MAG: hypothetical protein LC808_41865, partial [Actinobacteria bacterium]|nr:hypothetical protein [Actinomycetota bacterium]
CMPKARWARALAESEGRVDVSSIGVERDFVNTLVQVLVTLGSIALAMIAILYPLLVGRRWPGPVCAIAFWLSVAGVAALVYLPVVLVVLMHIGWLGPRTVASSMLMLASVGVWCIMGAVAALAPSWVRS